VRAETRTAAPAQPLLEDGIENAEPVRFGEGGYGLVAEEPGKVDEGMAEFAGRAATGRRESVHAGSAPVGYRDSATANVSVLRTPSSVPTTSATASPVSENGRTPSADARSSSG